LGVEREVARIMKIYTKTGDKGTTALFGGARLSKAHIRIEAYGNVDELNSHLGLIRDLSGQESVRKMLTDIQSTLFTVGSHLAADPSKENLWLPEISPNEVETLEKWIDELEETLSPLKSFILPGGSALISHCHIARCVCRRAERSIVLLSEHEQVEDIIMKYVNRLSDLLFTMSRYVAKQQNVEEIKWESGR